MQPQTWLDIIQAALFEIGALAPGDSLDSDDSSFVLKKGQALIDRWNASQRKIYGVDFIELTLVPNVQPLTIGQGVTITATSLTANVATYTAKNNYIVGDIVSTAGCTNGGSLFNVNDQIVTGANSTSFITAIAHADQASAPEAAGMAIYATEANEFPNYVIPSTRPVAIADANLIFNNVNPTVRVPLRIRDKDWWMANQVRQTPSTTPTDLYYNPVFPNGELNLWPLQTQTYGLELEAWLNLSEVKDLASEFYLPPGYFSAVVSELAIDICSAYLKTASPELIQTWRRNLRVIEDVNAFSPLIPTTDMATSNRGGKGTYFNWLSGQIVPGRRI